MLCRIAQEKIKTYLASCCHILTTQINLMRAQKAQPFAIRVRKTALEKQMGNAPWENRATAELSAVQAGLLSSQVTLDKTVRR